MNQGKSKTVRTVAALVLLMAAAIVIPSAVRVQGQADIPRLPRSDYPVKFDVRGVQTDSSSPFLVYIDTVGPGVWQRLVGPVLSDTITIPAAAGFGGASCQLEYSQDQIVIEDGSTLTFNVHGVRCVDADSPGAHSTTGNYSIVAGTGRFTKPYGTGTISIETQADGTSFITITGGCYQGMCGLRP